MQDVKLNSHSNTHHVCIICMHIGCGFVAKLSSSYACHHRQFKKLKELNKLKREMEGTGQRLREAQGEKVAHNYLTQFSSPARGRPLNGLGQAS